MQDKRQAGQVRQAWQAELIVSQTSQRDM
jgi:hypothetical protein